MSRVVRYIVSKTYQPFLKRYLSKTRTYSYKGIVLQVPPEVFHPGFFSSTKLLLRYLKGERLEGKAVLELGAGSGLISIHAVHAGAQVTATDINKTAVDWLFRNAAANNVSFSIVHSDLFEKMESRRFDFIIINPPYYKKNPSSEKDYAWYCGENGEYFQRLFDGLTNVMSRKSLVLMSLCDGCDLDMIFQLAAVKGFDMHRVYMNKTVLEKNYIYKIVRVDDR
jgi:release factor glutamine methyltransferase